MTHIPLWFDIGAYVVLTAVYIRIATLVGRRAVPGAARMANQGFVVWWLGLAFLYVTALALRLVNMFAAPPLTATLALTLILLLAIVAALAGLQLYLVYIYTGSERALPPIAVAYTVLGMGLVTLILWRDPVSMVVENGHRTIQYANETPRAVSLLTSLLLVGPGFAAAIAYASLFFQVTGAQERYRVALVSGAFIMWFGSSILGTAFQWTGSNQWTVISRSIALVAAFMVLAAFEPPARVRRLWADPAPAASR